VKRDYPTGKLTLGAVRPWPFYAAVGFGENEELLNRPQPELLALVDNRERPGSSWAELVFSSSAEFQLLVQSCHR
jgi:hypothetical protein